MNKRKGSKKKEGFSLVAVLSFMAIISTFLALMLFSSSQRTFTATRLADGIQAKALAEAGCEYAYSVLSSDWSALDDVASLSSMDESQSPKTLDMDDPLKDMRDLDKEHSCSITVSPVGTSAALVSATGSYGSATAESIVAVHDIGGSSDDGSVLDEVAFSYAILCGGDFDFRGCGSISGSDKSFFHSNGRMFIRGNVDALIDLSTSSTIKIRGAHVVVSGEMTEHAPVVPIPDIDLTPFYNWANDHGEVHEGGITITSDYTPDGGILWVNGDVKISTDSTISGSVIATGDIRITAHATVNPTTCAFGLVSRDGDILLTAWSTLSGLIYAKNGNFHDTAHSQITGQIIVKGDIDTTGQGDILAGYVQNIPAPPGTTPSTDNIVVAAWQK